MSSYRFQKLCLFNAVKKNSQLLSQFTYKTYILLIMSSYKSTILSFIIYHIMTCHLFFTWTRDIVKCPQVWLLFSKCISIYYNNFHNFYCNLFTWVVVNSWSMRIDTVLLFTIHHFWQLWQLWHGLIDLLFHFYLLKDQFSSTRNIIT